MLPNNSNYVPSSGNYLYQYHLNSPYYPSSDRLSLPSLLNHGTTLEPLKLAKSGVNGGTNRGSRTSVANSDAPITPKKRRKIEKNAPISDEVNFPYREFPDYLLKDVPQSQIGWIPAKNAISKRKYSTSIDCRNFLTVYEYSVNDHWIIWDYHTGYVHLTGLWKAIGNNKADIVKLVDNAPELEPLVRRVRGGYLKIQGTWLPFNIAKILASRICFHIRYCLIPIFGENFPNECLRPNDLGFGQLKLTLSETKKRRRRSSRKESPPSPNTPSMMSSSISSTSSCSSHTSSSFSHTHSLSSSSYTSSSSVLSYSGSARSRSYSSSYTTSSQYSTRVSQDELLDILNASRSLQQLSNTSLKLPEIDSLRVERNGFVYDDVFYNLDKLNLVVDNPWNGGGWNAGLDVKWENAIESDDELDKMSINGLLT